MNKTIRYAAIALLSLGSAFTATAQNMTVMTRDGQKHLFKTADVEQVTFDGVVLEDGPFDISVSEITSGSAKLDIVPEDNSLTYYFDVCLKSDYERTTVKRIVENYFQQIQNQYPQLELSQILEAVISRGADSDVVEGLPSDTEMVCYAIGVGSDGLCVGEPSVVPFRTLPPGKPEDCTFDISYANLSSSDLTVIVKPSDPSVRYWMGIAGVFDYPGDEEITYVVKANLEQYCNTYGRDMKEIVEGVTFRGNLSMVESGLEPDRPYYIYVYAMDEEGNAAGQVARLKFITGSDAVSGADVSLSFCYFSGDELAEAYPDRFGNAKEGVLMHSEFTPNEEASMYFWALSPGDISDTSVYPDETTKMAAQMYGFANTPSKNLLVRYGKATFIYFASNEYGLDGQLHRLVVDVTPEGCSPVEAFAEIDGETPQAVVPGQLKIRKANPMTQQGRVRARLSKLNAVPVPMRELELF